MANENLCSEVLQCLVPYSIEDQDIDWTSAGASAAAGGTSTLIPLLAASLASLEPTPFGEILVMSVLQAGIWGSADILGQGGGGGPNYLTAFDRQLDLQELYPLAVTGEYPAWIDTVEHVAKGTGEGDAILFEELDLSDDLIQSVITLASENPFFFEDFRPNVPFPYPDGTYFSYDYYGDSLQDFVLGRSDSRMPGDLINIMTDSYAPSAYALAYLSTLLGSDRVSELNEYDLEAIEVSLGSILGSDSELARDFTRSLADELIFRQYDEETERPRLEAAIATLTDQETVEVFRTLGDPEKVKPLLSILNEISPEQAGDLLINPFLLDPLSESVQASEEIKLIEEKLSLTVEEVEGFVDPVSFEVAQEQMNVRLAELEGKSGLWELVQDEDDPTLLLEELADSPVLTQTLSEMFASDTLQQVMADTLGGEIFNFIGGEEGSALFDQAMQDAVNRALDRPDEILEEQGLYPGSEGEFQDDYQAASANPLAMMQANIDGQVIAAEDAATRAEGSATDAETAQNKAEIARNHAFISAVAAAVSAMLAGGSAVSAAASAERAHDSFVATSRLGYGHNI